jgi:hypothetical protein
VSSYQSDERGHFLFETDAMSSITLVAKADGFSSSEMTFLPGTVTSLIEFMLFPVGRLSGRVVDEKERGVAGATVHLLYLGRKRVQQFGHELGDVTTDDFGYFTLPFVERGPAFVIEATVPGRLMASSSPMGLGGESMGGVLIALTDKGQVVRGKVVDSRGKPVSAATIRLRWLNSEETEDAERDRNNSLTAMQETNRVAITTSDGTFTFTGVRHGTVVIVASRSDLKPAKFEGTVTADVPLDINLVLSDKLQ